MTKALVPTVVQEDKPTPERAYTVYYEILERKSRIARDFIELGKLFKDVRDQKLYEILDYETFNTFIGAPEIAFSRSTVYSLIDIYELFVIESNIEQDRLVKIPWSKLNMIKGQYKKTRDEDLLFKAETLSQKDLIDEIRLLEGKESKEYTSPKEEKPTLEITDFQSYEAFVKEYGCVLCGKENPDAHHFPKTKGAGAPAHWVIPLCRECHTLYQNQLETFLTTYRNKIFQYFYDIILSIFKYLAEEKNDDQTT